MAEKRFIPFLQAAREGIIEEGDRVDISACLPKAEGVVKFATEETGWYVSQKFDRKGEKNLKWSYFKDTNGIPSFVSTPTDFKLYLNGMAGYANGPAVLQRICWTFANPKIGMSARSICYDDTRKNFDERGKYIWLASPYFFTFINYDGFGLRCVDGGCVSYYNLYTSHDIAFYRGYAVCPVVSILTSDIQIDLYSKDKDGIWKLVPPKEV